jgi:hypothetical protein
VNVASGLKKGEKHALQSLNYHILGKIGGRKITVYQYGTDIFKRDGSCGLEI